MNSQKEKGRSIFKKAVRPKLERPFAKLHVLCMMFWVLQVEKSMCKINNYAEVAGGNIG